MGQCARRIEHLIGCQFVKLFLLNYVNITIVTNSTVTITTVPTVTITTVTVTVTVTVTKLLSHKLSLTMLGTSFLQKI